MDNNKLQQTRELYHFGAFRLDAAERRLWCDDEPISLAPKQFDLLFYFVENAGRVAKKSELLDAVWTDTFVEESTLARNISWLRKELAEFADGEPLIETVPKLGYRFTAKVTKPENNGNEFIIEEQTVWHFRGQEVITIDDAFAERSGEIKKGRKRDEEKKIVALSNNSPSPVSPSSLLLSALALVALFGIGFALYRNNTETNAQPAESNANAKITIENITVDAAREAVDTGIRIHKGDVIKISVAGDFQPGADQTPTFEGDKNADVSAGYTFQKAAPRSLVGWIGIETDRNDYFQVSENNTVTADKNGILYFAVNNLKDNSADNSGEIVAAVTLIRTAIIKNPQIKIGSIVNLQNRYPNDGGYLDAWGQVWSKPEFSKVPTETMLVSTHRSSNRDNGSGSWEIVSATGKSNGEILEYGDKIHLKNRYPNAGYLDNCGFVKHLPVFKDYLDQTSAIFTTQSPNRDKGTGIWVVKSAAKYDGSPVIEGDSISLKNNFYDIYKGEILEGGLLNVTGYVKDIPAFDDYDGSRLVFTLEPSAVRPNPDIWTITVSKAILK